MVYGASGLRAVKGNWKASRTPLESGDKESDILVGEAGQGQTEPEYRGTREIPWEAGGTTPQA